MPFPAIIPGLIAGAKFAAPYAGKFLASGLGQAAITSGAGALYNRFFGGNNGNKLPQQQVQAEQELLNERRTPYNFTEQEFNPIAQRSREQFRNQTLPELATYFGGQRGSAYQNALTQATSDFDSQLNNQRAQYALHTKGLNEGRLGALQSYLGSQQSLANNQYQFGREQGLQQGNFGQNLFNNYANLQAGQNPLNWLSPAYNSSIGTRENIQIPGTQGAGPKATQALLNILLKAGGAAAGIPT